MAYSFGGVSSFMKTAAASYNRTQNLNDLQRSTEYLNSNKSASDLQTYTDYLKGRQSDLQYSDPTKAYTMGNEMNSAFKSHVSAEINRSSIAIMEGGGTQQDKYNTIVSNLHQANAVGDYALVQSLTSQADSLSISMQNAATAASKVLAENRYNTHADALSSGQDFIKQIQNAFKTGEQPNTAQHAGDPAGQPSGPGGQKAIAKFIENNPGIKQYLQSQGIKGQSYAAILTAMNGKLAGDAGTLSADPSLTRTQRNDAIGIKNAASGAVNSLAPTLQSEMNGQVPTHEVYDASSKTWSQKPNAIDGVQMLLNKDTGQYTPQVIYNKNDTAGGNEDQYKTQFAALAKDKNFLAAGGRVSNGTATVMVPDGYGGTTEMSLIPHANGFALLDPSSPSGLSNINFDTKTGGFTAPQQMSLAQANDKNYVDKFNQNLQDNSTTGLQNAKSDFGQAGFDFVKGTKPFVNGAVDAVGKAANDVATGVSSGKWFSAATNLMGKASTAITGDINGLFNNAQQKQQEVQVTAAEQAKATAAINSATAFRPFVPQPVAAPAPAPVAAPVRIQPNFPVQPGQSTVVPGQSGAQVAHTVDSINTAIGGIGHI